MASLTLFLYAVFPDGSIPREQCIYSANVREHWITYNSLLKDIRYWNFPLTNFSKIVHQCKFASGHGKKEEEEEEENHMSRLIVIF